eukprot:COSAG01_NODE_23957_length_795_cov_2.074713_1_plen_23_part_10
MGRGIRFGGLDGARHSIRGLRWG